MPQKKKTLRTVPALLMSLILCAYVAAPSLAAGYDDYSPGTYEVGASLSCYVSAMGGIEFGKPLLTKATVTKGDDDAATMTLNFSKSSVTIYSVTCDTFVDASPTSATNDRGVSSGTIGYYDANGILQTSGVSHTLSSSTALNAANESVHYVDSITFPLDRVSDKYYLTMYINSNVMGVQFCNNNASATTSTYPAVLSVTWPAANTGNAQEAASATPQPVVTDTPSTAVGAAAQTLTPKVSNTPNAPDSPDEGGASGENQVPMDPIDHLSGANSYENIVSDDGLTIHYADDTNIDNTAIADENAPLTDLISPDGEYAVGLNMTVVTALAICAGVLILAGIFLILSTKYTIKKREIS